jgi:DNA-binding MarR family transcriptional regulator
MTQIARDLLTLNRTIHEPARLVIVAILYAAEKADFLYLLRETELTRGNLSSHLTKLEKAEYIQIEKLFVGKTPRTILQLTEEGREEFDTYRDQIQELFKII